MRATLAGLALVVAAGCTPVTRVESPDPATIPSGEPAAEGAEPTGPITVLHADRVSGIGWRLVVYDSADGPCMQFETAAVTETGCGPLLPEGNAVFGGVSESGDESGLRPIHGIVTAEVATVWLVGEDDGTRVPALLMPLDEAGLEGQAFIGFAPEGATITHLQAVRMSGEIVETYELP